MQDIKMVRHDEVNNAIGKMVSKIGLPQSTHIGHFDQAYEFFGGRRSVPFDEFMATAYISPYVKELVIENRP